MGKYREFWASSSNINTDVHANISGRCSVGVAEVNNKVYAAGGYDRGHCLHLVECYDQERNEWVPTTPLKCPRGRLGLSCLDGM
jgi:hypothetical protein